MFPAALEPVAVALAVGYLLLAARENLWCWACALLSSLIYVWLFFDVRLLMESVLNVFYAVMAVVGWLQWRKGGAGGAGASAVQIHCLRWQQHLALMAAMLLLALANGWFMQRFTDAVWPFVDSFTTWASVLTTVLVIRKVLENWLYWIVIDSVSLYLYVDRGLHLTALLFAAYLVICVFGFLHWRRLYRAQLAGTEAEAGGRGRG